MLPSSARSGMQLAGGSLMPERDLAARVENLERRIELLEALPERVRVVELLIVDLRSEMREQFSAVRREFHEEIQTVKNELHTEIQTLGRDLRAEIQAGDEDTRRYMRVLHEEVLSRFSIIQEGLPRRRKR